MIPVLFFLSLFLGVLAAAMLVPALVAIALQEAAAGAVFLLASGLIGFLSGAIFFALRGRERGLRRAESFSLTLLAWLVLAIAAAGPIAQIGGIDAVSALFEATSGLTTTGATVFERIDALPRSLVLWRAELQWLGGLLTLLTLVLVLAPAGVGGLPHQHVRIDPHRHGRHGRRVRDVIRTIVFGYLGITLACLVLLVGTGMPLFDAACVTLSTVSTGGFLPHDGTLSAYANPAAEFVLILFMLIGATSIVWHGQLVRARFASLRAHLESLLVVAAGLGIGLLYAVSFLNAAGGAAVLPIATALREGLFTGVSLVTTSGFEARDGGFTILPVTAVMAITFVGGATFSTAGGVKVYRMGAMLVQAKRELARLIHPHSVPPSYLGEQRYSLDLMKAIWAQFCMAIGLVALTAALVTLDDVNVEDALTVAVGAFANMAALYTTDWPGGATLPAFSDFADRTKMLLAAVMILGRLEILVVFGAFRTFWWGR